MKALSLIWFILAMMLSNVAWKFFQVHIAQEIQ